MVTGISVASIRTAGFLLFLSLLSFAVLSAPAFADISPPGCTGSGLGINLFTSSPQVHIGDTVSYSAVVFNGGSFGPIVCDATGITAAIVTPDGVNHPLTLTRTTLSNGQFDLYTNVVSYVAQAMDMTPQGTLNATASDIGTIHQNIVNSTGGGNQGLNVYVLNTLHIIKQVINDNGGVATPASFSVHVQNAGVDVAGSPAPGTGAPGTLYSLIAGTYNVSEATSTAYAQTFSGDCDASGTITIVGGDDKTCTITNDDIPPATIKVIKIVINDNGGTKVVSDFPLFVGATPVVSGATTVFPAPASYTVTETMDPGYAQTYSGDCDVNGLVTLVPGDNKVCTITNDDIPPAAATINVVKTVINDNGGVKVVSDFPLFVGTTSVTSGATNVFAAGTYAVSETSDPNYLQSFSGDCDVSGNVVLAAGDHKVCIITNDDIPPPVAPAPPSGGGGGGGATPLPPLIDVVKVPNPLALPNGPGMVTYTYTLRNIGVVPVTDITMVGDTCRPITLMSGDTNHDNILDVNETWVYQCSTFLPATHTNIVTATGWANGLSAVDIASATVVVGAPIVPPLIHVTKIPNPLLLPIVGGVVTYTESVSNPGIVPLENVQLIDDKCSPVNYVSGDTNNDGRLDPSETWVYICTMSLTKNTTNTAIASGEANGITVRDFAVATVLVAIPGFPNTGFAPSLPWGIILVGLIVLILLIGAGFFIRKKKS